MTEQNTTRAHPVEVLRATATFIERNPVLLEFNVIHTASVSCYPEHRADELIEYLRVNGIPFQLAPLRSSAMAICIQIVGTSCEIWISNVRLADLSDEDRMFLLGSCPDDISEYPAIAETEVIRFPDPQPTQPIPVIEDQPRTRSTKRRQPKNEQEATN